MGLLARQNAARHNRMIRNIDLFLAQNGSELRKNAIAKMKRDGQDTNNAKLVEQCVALYISACIREIKQNQDKYLLS